MEHIPFPFDRDEEVPIPDDDPLNHPCLRVLEREMDISHTCGYLTMLRTGGSGTVYVCVCTWCSSSVCTIFGMMSCDICIMSCDASCKQCNL